MSDDLPPGATELGGPVPGEEEAQPIPDFGPMMKAAGIAVRRLAELTQADGDEATSVVRIEGPDLLEVCYTFGGGRGGATLYLPDLDVLEQPPEEYVPVVCARARRGALAADSF